MLCMMCHDVPTAGALNVRSNASAASTPFANPHIDNGLMSHFPHLAGGSGGGQGGTMSALPAGGPWGGMRRVGQGGAGWGGMEGDGVEWGGTRGGLALLRHVMLRCAVLCLTCTVCPAVQTR